MSNSQFKARALYDFNAEGPNELSFNANDILTITSNTAGHGWWYARNSSGQVGVIPENYVQALADPPEPNEPPPPLSTFSQQSNYLNLDGGFNSNNNTPRISSQPSFPPPPYEQSQHVNPTSYNNWQHQPSQITNKLSSSDTNTNSTLPITINNSLYDGYITVIDVSPPKDAVRKIDSNSSQDISTGTDEMDEWYDNLPKTPAPVLAVTNPFNIPKPTVIKDDYLVPMSLPKTDDLLLLNSSEDTITLSQSMPSELSLSKPNDTISIDENNLPLPVKKKKKTLVKMFTLTRKGKSKKKTTDETTHHSNDRDADSDDDFSDSEYPNQSSNNMNTQPKHPTVKRTNTLPINSTLQNQSRTSLANTEANRGPPRARFFDKHGLDNYLLNGSKAKVDEHVEISYDDHEGGVCWSVNPGLPPFVCRVEEPSKGTKLGGLKAFMEYKIHPQTPGSKVVGRRYKQFDWLHEQLVNKFRFICIPPLPGKQIAGRFEQEFIEERRRLLELWLNRICRHPVLCASFPVQHFVSCELTEKNKKDWKNGKRRIENDELRAASWLQCVTVANTGSSDPASQIDIFYQQQPGLESNLKNLSQGLIKYLERYTEVYERDIDRVKDLFSRVHQSVNMDTITSGNRELSNSISKISGSYGGIAELYKTKGSEGLRDFIERIQEYIGIIGCFPSILSIQRSASEFIKTAQQRGTTDFSSAIHRNHVLNHVVLAEINFFQKEKVQDLNEYMKTFVNEQIKFYENITSELRDASLTFK